MASSDNNESTAILTHPTSETPMPHSADHTTTPVSSRSTKTIGINKKAIRRAQNEEYLKNKNVSAFLKTIAWAEGGDYHALFGWRKGSTQFTFSDESSHPGPGARKNTAAGLYQENKGCWEEMGGKAQGLTDFSPHTQDLIAVENIRHYHAINNIISGDIPSAINKLKENQWTGLKRHKTDDLIDTYKKFGGETP